jgi:hypothetical protein
MSSTQPHDLLPLAPYRADPRISHQKCGLMTTFAMSLCIAFAALARATDPRDAGFIPLPPHVEFRSVHAAELRLGMTAADVVRIMGDAAETGTSLNGEVRMLDFRAEPIPTQVVIAQSKVSSISLNIARVDSLPLPAFAQPALVGMSSAGVRSLLGVPTDIRHYEFFGIRLEQLIFEHPNEAIISTFFVGDRVIKKTHGSAVPEDIFVVLLPAPPDSATCRPSGRASWEHAVIGMTQGELQELFGPPKLEVDYTFNGQPAAHALYQTREAHTLSAYFVGGVLTEIGDAGTWSVDDTWGG